MTFKIDVLAYANEFPVAFEQPLESPERVGLTEAVIGDKDAAYHYLLTPVGVDFGDSPPVFRLRRLERRENPPLEAEANMLAFMTYSPVKYVSVIEPDLFSSVDKAFAYLRKLHKLPVAEKA